MVAFFLMESSRHRAIVRWKPDQHNVIPLAVGGLSGMNNTDIFEPTRAGVA